VERAINTGSDATVELEASDGRITVVVSRVVYFKRYTRGAHPGFLSAS